MSMVVLIVGQYGVDTSMDVLHVVVVVTSGGDGGWSVDAAVGSGAAPYEAISVDVDEGHGGQVDLGEQLSLSGLCHQSSEVATSAAAGATSGIISPARFHPWCLSSSSEHLHSLAQSPVRLYSPLSEHSSPLPPPPQPPFVAWTRTAPKRMLEKTYDNCILRYAASSEVAGPR